MGQRQDSEQLQTKRRCRQEYFRLAGWFLNEHKFESRLSKELWQLHSMGYGRNEVYRLLRQTHRHLRLGTVRRILSGLVVVMKARYLDTSKDED